LSLRVTPEDLLSRFKAKEDLFIVLDLDSGDTCVGHVSLLEEGIQVTYDLVS